jgi:hypothetical protein
MSDLPQFKVIRNPRVKLQGAVLALVQLDDERMVRARLHQLSISGGVLQVADALEESANVRLIFHLGSTTMRTEAEMLVPMWSTRAYLQPFRFLSLAEEDRQRLERDLAKLQNGGLSSTERTARKLGEWT